MGNIWGELIGSSLGRGGMSVNGGVNVHMWFICQVPKSWPITGSNGNATAT